MSLIKLINIRGLLYHDEICWLQNGRLLKQSLKLGVFNIDFGITNKVQIKNASNLLFVLINNCKNGIIAFFYLFYLFKDPFIILISYNGFQHGGDKSFGTIVYVIPEFIRMTVILETFPSIAIQYIKMFYLKLFKIYLNISLKFIFFDVSSYTVMELICNLFIKQVRIGYLNIKTVSKKSF